MAKFPRAKLTPFIEKDIDLFHKRRLEKLSRLRLNYVLRRKNPYLFKAKALETAPDLVKSILEAHLSSQEEGIFGDFLERLAVFVCTSAYGGTKSSSPGIDLEFSKGGTHFVVAIKSGPYWGNSQQIERLKDNFRRAKRALRTSGSGLNVVAVDGCCYGKDDNPDKGEYLKYCGQMFWEFISGDQKLYIDVIEPIGKVARERNGAFQVEYAKVINRFSLDFGQQYCNRDGTIAWPKLLKFNSGKG